MTNSPQKRRFLINCCTTHTFSCLACCSSLVYERKTKSGSEMGKHDWSPLL